MAKKEQNLIGKRVRKLRMDANLSQDAFVARCQREGWDLSRGTFAKIEAGLRRVNDAEVAMVANVLMCSMDDLLGGFPKAAIKRCVRHGDVA